MGRNKKVGLDDIFAIENKYNIPIKPSSDISEVEGQFADLIKVQNYSKKCNSLIEKIQNNIYGSMINMLKNKTPISGQVPSEQSGSEGMCIDEAVIKYKKCKQTIINRIKEYKIPVVRKEGRKRFYDFSKANEHLIEDERGAKKIEKQAEQDTCSVKGISVKEIKKRYGVSEPTIYARKEEGLIKEIGKKGKAVLYEVNKDAFVKKKKR